MAPSVFSDIATRVRSRSNSDASHKSAHSARSIASLFRSSKPNPEPKEPTTAPISNGAPAPNSNTASSSFRLPHFPSLRRKPTLDSVKESGGSRKASYRSYTVHQQSMAPTVLRDTDATQKLLDYVLDGPTGRRALSRLARTCRAFCEPALNTLWRELDSLVPLVGLFPSTLLRRAKRPGLGLAKAPVEEDWKKVLEYGERVESIRYVESFNNVSPSIFPMIEEHRPRTWILPNLKLLTWRVDSPAGLDRALLFTHPHIEGIHLELGIRITKIDSFLEKVAGRTKLKDLSIMSTGGTTALPDNFTELMRHQTRIERLALALPGAVSSQVGGWVAALPHLKALQLDLSGRPKSAVDPFFSEMSAVRSMVSTPGSLDGTEEGEGVDGEKVDFASLRKGALRVTQSRSARAGPYAELRELQLTGAAGSIAAFLRRLPQTSLVSLELVIEDPPEESEWRELLFQMCERVGRGLQSLKVSATGASKFPELVRGTSKGDMATPTKRLPLDGMSALPQIRRIEFDLPTSVIFTNEDVERLAIACPALETLKLCPTARFPLNTGPPLLTLEGVSALTTRCRHLHTAHLVINASGATDSVLASRFVSSNGLLRLHVGHSWVKDSLQASILLSHLAPYLETFKWFHEKNRPGYIEAHAQGWQQVSDFLPHLQKLRLMERDAVIEELAAHREELFAQQQELEAQQQELEAQREALLSPIAEEPIPLPALELPEPKEPGPEPEIEYEIIPPREFAEKGVDATVVMVDAGMLAEPQMVDDSVQFSPVGVEEAIQAESTLVSTSVDATLAHYDEARVSARSSPTLTHRSLDDMQSPTSPKTPNGLASSESDERSETNSDSTATTDSSDAPPPYPGSFHVPSIGGIFALVRDVFISPPLYLSLRLMSASLATLGARNAYVEKAATLAEKIHPTATNANGKVVTEEPERAGMEVSPVCL